MQVNLEPTEGEIPQAARPVAGLTTKVVKGTLWTLVGLTVPILFSLFATPIVTRLLGAESYGLFVLILLIPSYFSFADFGMNHASTKFGSAAFAENSPEAEARIVRTAALVALISSMPLAAVMMIFSAKIVELFNVPEYLTGEGVTALRIAAVIFVVNFLNNIFNTPELSRLRMDLNIAITSGIRLAGIITTPVVVYLGGGVIGAVAVAACVSFVTLAGHLIVSSRLLPELAGFSIDREKIKPMMKFGWSLVVAGVAAVLLVNLEKFVLTKVTSVETLAYYSIAATFAAMLTLFSASIVQSLMPAFSQLQSEANRPALNALYSRGIRLTLIWLVPAVVFMVLVGRPFFTHWFGPDYGRESTGPFYIIVAGFFFNVLSYFPYTVIMASGRSDIFARIYWAELVPYIFLVWWLATTYGATGAAAAWSIRIAFDAGLLFTLASKVGGASYDRRNAGYTVIASLVMLLPIGLLTLFAAQNLSLLAMFSLCLLAYCFLVWKKVLSEDETSWLRKKAYTVFRRTINPTENL